MAFSRAKVVLTVQRKTSLRISLPRILGCTRHSQASLPLLSLARKFSLLIYRHTSALTGLSALRHRLYAEGRSLIGLPLALQEPLHILRVPGRFARATSELTAQRFKVLFFRRGSTAFRTFVPGGIVLVSSIETEPVLPTLSTFTLIVAPIDCVPPSIYQSAIAKALFVSDNGVHSR